MIAINAAMANQLNEFRASVEKLMEEGVGKDEAIFRILKETIIASEPIRFEGDGYSEEWKQEAARRGLTNICHVPEALMHYIDNQSKSVLIGERIFNETELNSRLEVELEKYTMKVQIEGRVLGDLAINHIVPTAVAYQNRLLENLRGLKDRSTKSCQPHGELQGKSICIRRKSTSIPRSNPRSHRSFGDGSGR